MANAAADHDNDNSPTCPTCRRTFVNFAGRRVHERRAHPETFHEAQAVRIAEAERTLYHAALAHGANHLIALISDAVLALNAAIDHSGGDQASTCRSTSSAESGTETWSHSYSRRLPALG